MKSFKEFVQEHYDEYGTPIDGGLDHDHGGMGPHSHPWDAPFEYEWPLEPWEKEWDPEKDYVPSEPFNWQDIYPWMVPEDPNQGTPFQNPDGTWTV